MFHAKWLWSSAQVAVRVGRTQAKTAPAVRAITTIDEAVAATTRRIRPRCIRGVDIEQLPWIRFDRRADGGRLVRSGIDDPFHSERILYRTGLVPMSRPGLSGREMSASVWFANGQESPLTPGNPGPRTIG